MKTTPCRDAPSLSNSHHQDFLHVLLEFPHRTLQNGLVVPELSMDFLVNMRSCYWSRHFVYSNFLQPLERLRPIPDDPNHAQLTWVVGDLRHTPLKTKMTLESPHFSIGITSSSTVDVPASHASIRRGGKRPDDWRLWKGDSCWKSPFSGSSLFEKSTAHWLLLGHITDVNQQQAWSHGNIQFVICKASPKCSSHTYSTQSPFLTTPQLRYTNYTHLPIDHSLSTFHP